MHGGCVVLCRSFCGSGAFCLHQKQLLAVCLPEGKEEKHVTFLGDPIEDCSRDV